MGKRKLSIFYIYKKVLFPYCMLFFRTSSKHYQNVKKGDMILVLSVRNFIDILFARRSIATLSEVVNIKFQDNLYRIQLKGISRVRLRKIYRLRVAEFEEIVEREMLVNEKLIEDLRKKTQELIFLINVKESDKLIHLLNFISSLNQLTDFISNYFIVKYTKRHAIFNELNVEIRARQLLKILDNLIKKFKDKRGRVFV
jgi:ATP-dependent Lon protease